MEENRFKSSAEVFEMYIKRENESINVEGIFSLKCYSHWLSTRRERPKSCEHSFRKAVTGCCRGDEGLKPFQPDVEYEILKFLRKKEVWPCFKGTKSKIGKRGFQSFGYWERKRLNIASSYELSTFYKPSQSQKSSQSQSQRKSNRDVNSIIVEIQMLQSIIELCNSIILMLKNKEQSSK